MKPELIAPVVLWLCHDSCTDNGSIIDAAAGCVGKCNSYAKTYYLRISSTLFFFILDRWQRSLGMAIRKNIKDDISPEMVRDNWEQICDFNNDPMYPESAQEITLHFARELYELAEKSGNDNSNS